MFLIFLTTTAFSTATYTIVHPITREATVTIEDAQMSYNYLKECKHLKEKWPEQYKNLDRHYIIVEEEENHITPLCGMYVPYNDTIYLYPKSWTNTGCYGKDYLAVVVHEMLHAIDLPDHKGRLIDLNDEVETATRECYLNLK